MSDLKEIEEQKGEIERLRVALVKAKLELSALKEDGCEVQVGGLGDMIFKDDRIGLGVPEKAKELHERNEKLRKRVTSLTGIVEMQAEISRLRALLRP